MEIEINGVQYTLKFGYGVLRKLSEKWKLTGVSAVIGQLQNIAGRELDVIVDLVFAALATSKYIDIDEVGDWCLQNTDKFQEIMNAFTASLPQPKETPGKPEAVATAAPENP